ncbi:MAG: 2-isopropylmalate synthase [Planctomycetes bacterium]|nr:2-isopropylmalate synthase [Planctomycetota bacterium]
MNRIEDLIHDWNRADGAFAPSRPLQFDDETLRDGLQSPAVSDPTLEQKIDLVERMAKLGIHTANIGLPGAGGRPREDILRLSKHVADNRLGIGVNVACRTVVSDIEPVVEMTQQAGIPIEVCAFIGSSYIRQYAEDWTLDRMLENTRAALTFARDHDLPVMYVTEDTTRARPETLRALYGTAIELGARRLCVCDTVGHATPEGTRAVVRFVRALADEHDPSLGVDWHGHRDRDLGIANCLAAIEAGADRIHGTALGVGERAGNAPMDQLLINCKLLGWIDNDLTSLPDYVAAAARALEVEIPHNYPALGTDAFETGTGVHAAAVIKAFKKGDVELADSVYSGVPAHMVGREQRIAIGPMAGRSNAAFVLEKLGIEPTEQRVERVLAAGKSSKRLLTDDEVRTAAERPSA